MALKNCLAKDVLLQNCQIWHVDRHAKPAIFLAMKGLFAMFFSLVLIVAQAAFINVSGDLGTQRASTPKCCGHCGNCGSCEGQSCCTARNDSGSERSKPAVPSRSTSRSDFQLSAAVAVKLLPETSAAPVTFPSSFSVRSSLAAPLYQRNCSYLI